MYNKHYETIQNGYTKFLEEYSKILEDLRNFKRNLIEQNEPIKDKYLPLEAFKKDENNFSELNRMGFHFSLKSYPIISRFNDRFYWDEWRLVDQNGILNFFTKPSGFPGKPEHYIYIQWNYFIDKLKETREEIKVELEFFIENLRIYNEENQKPLFLLQHINISSSIIITHKSIN